jgi:hypothetical protein
MGVHNTIVALRRNLAGICPRTREAHHISAPYISCCWGPADPDTVILLYSRQPNHPHASSCASLLFLRSRVGSPQDSLTHAGACPRRPSPTSHRLDLFIAPSSVFSTRQQQTSLGLGTSWTVGLSRDFSRRVWCETRNVGVNDGPYDFGWSTTAVGCSHGGAWGAAPSVFRCVEPFVPRQ